MTYDTIVLGAGAAGLAAARELARSGIRVAVLEARDRAGGRVRWARIPGSDETVELGAEFIHGPAPETRALLHETGGQAETRDGDEWVFENGRLVRDTDDFLDGGKLFESVGGLREDVSVDVFLEQLRREGRDPAMLQIARGFVEGFDAADPARASVRGIAHEWLSGVDSTAGRPSRGYAPVIERLEADATLAGALIMLSSQVVRVTHASGCVSVETARGDRYDARCIVNTLPVAVLRADDGPSFAPPLADAKRIAIQQIETGSVARLVLQFRTAFWEQLDDGRYRDAAFFRAPGGAFRAFWTQYPLRSRTIVAWAGGPRADELLHESQTQLAERAVHAFGELFGNADRARDEFETSYMHDWSRDPFARGAYSYLLVGGEDARVELARPVDDVLFFAGEATMNDGQGGTVNGAIASGMRAAREVLALFARSI